MSKLRKELRKQKFGNITGTIELVPSDEVEETEFRLQYNHYTTAEKRLLAGKLDDDTPTSNPSIISTADYKVFIALEDRYFKTRKRFERLCTEKECDLCDMSHWIWWRNEFRPYRGCSKTKLVSFQTYEDFISNL